MKKKTRTRLPAGTGRIFFGVLAGMVVIGIGIAAYLFYPREKPATVKIYFFKGEKPFAVERPLEPAESPLRKAIKELLAGPNQEETAQGIISQLPPGVKILSFKVEGKTAIINFNRRLETSSGGSARLQGMIAQIVYTATEPPGIEKVWIWIEGQKEVVLGGEGLVLDHPLNRGEIGY